MRRKEGYAVARDGSPIYYRLFGNESSDLVPLALTDGIGCDGYVWKYVERAFGQDRRLVHWHLRGHGRTPVPRDRTRVSITDCADDLEAILDQVGLSRVVLLGHSMGVQVSLEMFRRHRDRVAGLVLLCGSYGNPLRTFKGKDTLDVILPYLAFAMRMAPRFVHSLYKSVLPTKLAYAIATRVEINPELARLEDFMPYLEHMAQVDIGLFLEMLAYAGRHSARELLPEVDLPTLIVAGEKDGFTPRDLSEEMHKLIRGSELLIVEGGTHTAPIERPQLVNDAISRFLQRVS